ncbi:Inner membrane symporter yicJ [Raoultella terrigena]|uniref:Inner membrane symporter yicJ n=1 Tax=Raoultella terrigena TaxID=577 RepID=A0A4U9DC90_RAOTE|nr:Inner membrane symporter yicJ [Raoultella terrigena]
MKDLRLLFGNTQWRIMCTFKMMATCSNVVRGGATLYFVKYVMDHPEMAMQFLLYGSIATMFGSLASSRLLGPLRSGGRPSKGLSSSIRC